MATLKETVEAVIAELQKQGTNLQDTSIAGNANDFDLLLGFKSDGTFVRVSPSVLRDVTTQYLTKSDYDNLIALGEIKDNVEYNIIENEQVLE